MKNSTQCVKQLNALLKRIRPGEPPVFDDARDPVAVLVLSFLMWESTTPKAMNAYKNIREQAVDFNDLRVSMPEEIAEMLGSRYPRGQERAERLRATLRDIYLREHAVHLQRLTDMGKREARHYLESLDGMVPYVAARVLLLCYDGHAIPVDEQLRTRLIAEGACDEDVDVAGLGSWLERQIKAAESTDTHFAFQSWIDADGSAKKSGSKRTTTRKKSTGKKTTKRKTKRPAAG